MAVETIMKEFMKKWILWVLMALLLLAAVLFLNAAMFAAWQGSFPGRDISKYTMWEMLRLGVAVLYAVTLIALQVRHWRESKWLLWALTILLLLGAWPFLLLAIQNVWLEPDPWEDKKDNVMCALLHFGLAVVYVETPIILWKSSRQGGD